jgi:aspartate oxidase
MPRLSTKTDVLIIGAGLAGTSLALSLPCLHEGSVAEQWRGSV